VAAERFPAPDYAADARRAIAEEVCNMLELILLIVLVMLLLGALPAWPYSRSWGYAPSGTLGLVLIILLLVVIFQRI
jgi:hypothetical protein